jgi:ATP synthase F1 delta subunit
MSASTKLVKTYAKSLFQNLNKGDNNSTQDDSFSIAKITSSEQKNFLPDIFIVGEELLLLRATLISSEKLSIVFKDPTYSESQKLEILSSIFPGLTITTKSFLKVLTERTHLSLLPLISEEFTTILLKIKNTTKVNLIAASQLETNFGSMLLTTLKKLTNSSEIILTTAYNPKLLGGIILEYNSVAIDASILKEFSLFFDET